MLKFCLLAGVLSLLGCEQPQGDSSAYADDSLKGIKLSDLQPTQKAASREPQIIFSILTYELDEFSLDSLSKVYRELYRRGIVYEDKTAFDANGFSTGSGMAQKGSEVVKLLAEIGAARVAQTRIGTWPQTQEILTETPVSSQVLLFPKSHRTLGSAKIQEGRLGWIFSVEKDPVSDAVLMITVQPASWDQGMADLRLLEGKTPFQYKTLNVGRFQMDLKEGGFFLLGPSGAILTQQTLSQLLFASPRPNKKRLLLVILEKAER